jgi:NAD(P)-dependent dehydrogenase (short-subunit alcohol dehydrogenase family)
MFLDSVDASDAGQVGEAVRRTVDRFGQIDILANTVGGYRPGRAAHDTPLDTFDFLLRLNLRTAIVLSQAVVPYMLERGTGGIVHTAARSGLKGGARSSAYSISKSGVLRLVESMAAELQPDGIRVNCVMPGTIDTPQNRKAMPKADTSTWVAPSAIADVFLFLASDAARAVTGAAVPV